MAARRVTGHVETRNRGGGPVFFAKLKLPDGQPTPPAPRQGLGEAQPPPTGYLTRSQAEARLEAILAGDDPQVNIAPSHVTFGAACDEHLRYLEHDRLGYTPFVGRRWLRPRRERATARSSAPRSSGCRSAHRCRRPTAAIDVKRYPRFCRPGHAVTGDRRASAAGQWILEPDVDWWVRRRRTPPRRGDRAPRRMLQVARCRGRRRAAAGRGSPRSICKSARSTVSRKPSVEHARGRRSRRRLVHEAQPQQRRGPGLGVVEPLAVTTFHSCSRSSAGIVNET
jgi:hypothetical protein